MKVSRILVVLQAILICIMVCLYGCSGGGSDSPAPLSSEKAITAYSINGVDGTINETAKTILVIMPYGTDVTTLVATFNTTGSTVRIDATQQVSGKTANNFTTPMTYTVTAVDSSTQAYVVTVIETWKIISTLKFYSSYSPTRLALQNRVAFVGDGSIRIIDVSTPATPAVFSTIGNADASQGGYSYFMGSVSVSNNKLLLGGRLRCTGWCDVSPFGGNLFVYDITDRAYPLRISYLLGIGGDMILENNIAYVSVFDVPSRLYILDVLVQTTPAILGSVDIKTAGKLAKSGNMIFISCNSVDSSTTGHFQALDTVDVTNQTSPQVLYTGSTGAMGVAHDSIVLSGNTAYISDRDNGVLVLDISNPLNQSLVLTIPALSSITDTAVDNGYLYAADAEYGIRVFDISNTLNPVYVRTISTTPYAATLVAVSGGVGVVALIDPSSTSCYYLGVFIPEAH